MYFVKFQGHVALLTCFRWMCLNVELYAQQMQREYDALKAYNSALIHRRRAFLQHNNALTHTANVIKRKLENLDVLSLPAYSPDLVLSNYYHFSKL